jgi:hypothetical protein
MGEPGTGHCALERHGVSGPRCSGFGGVNTSMTWGREEGSGGTARSVQKQGRVVADRWGPLLQ